MSDKTFAVIMILIIGYIWAHRAMIPTVEHWLLIALLSVGIIIVLNFLNKLRNRVARRRLEHIFDISGVDNMDGLVFERYVARLLKKQGYTGIRLTERYDYGVDIIAHKDNITWGIQVKRYRSLVKAEAVRQVVTGLKKYDCDRAMVITNSTFSHVAKELASSNNCALVDRKDLSGWISV